MALFYTWPVATCVTDAVSMHCQHLHPAACSIGHHRRSPACETQIELMYGTVVGAEGISSYCHVCLIDSQRPRHTAKRADSLQAASASSLVCFETALSDIAARPAVGGLSDRCMIRTDPPVGRAA